MIDWYHRNEAKEPWVIAACAKHGPELEALRFRRGVPPRFGELGAAEVCALCRGTTTLDEIRACRCHAGAAGCPVHGESASRGVPSVVRDEPPTGPIVGAESPIRGVRARRASSLPPIARSGFRVIDGGRETQEEDEIDVDARRAMVWWNAMTEAQREAVMQAGYHVLGYGPSVAEVWNLRVAGEITGPRPPHDAKPIAIPPAPQSPSEPEIEEMSRETAAEFIARAREVTRLRRERWGDSNEGSMTRLARRFPSLRHARGIEPWDAMTFLRWACDENTDLTSGMLHTVRFLLQVWNSATDWVEIAAANGLDGRHLTTFNLVAACAAWDEEHRAACLAWLEAPFFP